MIPAAKAAMCARMTSVRAATCLSAARRKPMRRLMRSAPTPGGADPLRQPPAADPPEQLELTGAVLPLAEPDGEGGVVVVLGVDVGNAVLVAADGDGRATARARAVRRR